MKPSTRKSSRPRPRWFRALFVALIVVPGIVITECALRLFWHPDWPFYAICSPAVVVEVGAGLWAPRPFMDTNVAAPGRRTDGTTDKDASRTVRMRTNSLGCRGPEIEHRAGELRLLMAGDSLVFGHLVSEDEAFAFRVGPALEQAIGRPVTTLNCGCPGYGLTVACRRASGLLEAFDPQVVVVGMCLSNDMVEDVEQSAARVIGNRAFTGWLALTVADSWRTRASQTLRLWLLGEQTLHHLAPSLSMLMEPQLTAEEQALIAGVPDSKHAMGGLFLEAIDERNTWPGDPPVLPRLFARLEATLRRLCADMAGRRLLLLVEPNRFQLDPAKRLEALARMGFDPSLYRTGLLQQRVNAVCAAVGIATLDLTATMAADAEPASLFLGDDYLHLSPKGNALVADAVVSRLSSMAGDSDAAKVPAAGTGTRPR